VVSTVTIRGTSHLVEKVFLFMECIKI
jgi:hypothetical protein